MREELINPSQQIDEETHSRLRCRQPPQRLIMDLETPPHLRLSIQLYGHVTSDLALLRDLEEAGKVTPEQVAECEALLRRIYLPQLPDQLGDAPRRAPNYSYDPLEQLFATSRAAAVHAWDDAVSALPPVPVIRPLPKSQPIDHLAACLSTCSLSPSKICMEPTPPWEGVAPFPFGDVPGMALMERGIDLLSEERVPVEAVVAAAALCSPQSITKLTTSQQLLLTRHLSKGDSLASWEDSVHPISVVKPTPEMRKVLHKIFNYLYQKWGTPKNAAHRLSVNFSHGPARHSKKQIMFGICGGQRQQPPYSHKAGQYQTPGTANDEARVNKALADEQRALKTGLQKLLNEYALLAAEQVRELMPQVYQDMKAVRDLLSIHPLHGTDAAWDAGNIPFKNPIFTNGYVALGERFSRYHTDYRNAHATHLTTMLFGETRNVQLTGQTVLFNRYGTRAVVIEDSHEGRNTVGGLNAFAHGNFMRSP